MAIISGQSAPPAEKPVVAPAGRSAKAGWVAVIARWILGLVFVYMGGRKILDPVEFLKLVKEYELGLGPPWLNIIAATLPWFELFCGLLLLAGVALRGVALNLLLMLIPFSIIILRRALEISRTKGTSFFAVMFDCGCGAGQVVIWQKLIENCALILLAAWLLARKENRLNQLNQ